MNSERSYGVRLQLVLLMSLAVLSVSFLPTNTPPAFAGQIPGTSTDIPPGGGVPGGPDDPDGIHSGSTPSSGDRYSAIRSPKSPQTAVSRGDSNQGGLRDSSLWARWMEALRNFFLGIIQPQR